MRVTEVFAVVLAALFLAPGALGQAAPPSKTVQPTINCDRPALSTYLLGPNDQLETSGPEPDELNSKSTVVDSDGAIQVPLLGRVHVAGLTVEQAEQEVNKRLGAYIRHPQFAINLKELRSQPVSILGAVNNPGVHQVQGHQTLLEMISLAGGIRQDAGYSVRITRELEWGCIALPDATLDASGRFSVAEVNLQEIMEAKKPQENIQIFPHDVVSVPKAEMVYVIGGVNRSGGFVLGEHKSISVLQALSLAEGLRPAASARDAKIMRANRDSDQRTEIPVDVKGILTGKKKDLALQSDDILFVPDSNMKKGIARVLEATIQAGTNIAIWRIPIP